MAIQRIEQEKEIRKHLQEVLGQLTSIKIDSLIRRKELGTSLNFEEGKPIFERTLKLFKDLSEASLDIVPYNSLNQIKSTADQALNRFNEIQNFDPNQGNPAEQRTTLINAVANGFDGHFNIISPIISYSIRKGIDFEKLENNARNLTAKMEDEANTLKETATKYLKDIKDTLEKVRRAAAEVGVAQHAVHFRDQADEHINKTRQWLIATATFALLTLAYGAYNVWYYTTHIAELTNTQSLQLGVSKLVILSVLYSAALWAGRVYKSQWHNYIVNKHRQNALSTFETFVKSTSDDQTKNAVLLQATQSIFSLQNSGFVTRGSDRPSSPQILEVFKNVVGATEVD